MWWIVETMSGTFRTQAATSEGAWFKAYRLGYIVKDVRHDHNGGSLPNLRTPTACAEF